MKHLIKLTTLLSLTGLLLIMNNSCEPECETCQEPPQASDQTFSVAEESPGGTSVGFIKAESTSGALSYHMVSDIAAHYFVVNETTGEITVRDSAVLDYETQQSYTFDAVVTDTKDDGYSVTLTIIVNITDVDELKKGLVAYYPFNGNANDETGNGYDGVLKNAPTLTEDRFGNSNSAYEFDGVDDYIELNNNEKIISKLPFSISVWANVKELTDANYVFCQRDMNTEHSSSLIGLSTDNTYTNKSRFSLRNSGQEQSVDFETEIQRNGEWHLYSVTIDENGNVKFFIDEQMVESGVFNYATTLFDNIDMVAIGGVIRNGLGNYYFNGYIDDVRIYDRVLNPSEIQSLYTENGWTGDTSNVNLKDGLAAYYPFNGNANDESGNENHGVLEGPVLTSDRFGNNNSAYDFDGTDDYILVSASNTINNIWDNGGSISFWVYLDNITDWDRFFAKDKSDDMGGQYWSIHLHDVGNYLQLEDHFSDYKGEWYTGNYIPNTGEWIHMVVAYDSDTTSNDVIFYINGKKENTIRRRTPNGTRPDDSLRDLFIGGDNSEIYEHFFDGKMDDIRIYNRILSDDEVQTLFSQNGWGK